MKVLYLFFFASNLLIAAGHVDSAYAYARNHAPYTIALHALQETLQGTQFNDKVPQVWYVAPGGTQVLGRVDTLSHVRVTGKFADNSTAPDSLRTMVDISLPREQKGKFLLITIFVVNDEWRAETIYVNQVATEDSGVSGYSAQVVER